MTSLVLLIARGGTQFSKHFAYMKLQERDGFRLIFLVLLL